MLPLLMTLFTGLMLRRQVVFGAISFLHVHASFSKWSRLCILCFKLVELGLIHGPHVAKRHIMGMVLASLVFLRGDANNSRWNWIFILPSWRAIFKSGAAFLLVVLHQLSQSVLLCSLPSFELLSINSSTGKVPPTPCRAVGGANSGNRVIITHGFCPPC